MTSQSHMHSLVNRSVLLGDSSEIKTDTRNQDQNMSAGVESPVIQHLFSFLITDRNRTVKSIRLYLYSNCTRTSFPLPNTEYQIKLILNYL